MNATHQLNLMDLVDAGPAIGNEPKGSAIFSSEQPTPLYRYRLERILSERGPTVAWIMVNPSVATAETDDPTIRKVIGFSQRMGASRIIVGNLFAFRATDIKALRTAADPIGIDGGDHMRRIMDEADKVIVAWGPCAKLPKWLRNRWHEVAGYAEARGITLFCIGTAGDGHPLHPLMPSYDRPILPWSPPGRAPVPHLTTEQER